MNPHQVALLKQFSNLSNFAQKALKICSIYYTPMSTSSLLYLLKKLNIIFLDDNKTAITNKILESTFDNLVRLGFMFKSKDDNKKVEVSPDMVEIITRLASKEKNFNKIINIVKENTPYYSYYSFNDFKSFVRNLRIAIYTNNFDEYDRNLRYISKFSNNFNVYEHIFNNPFDIDFIKTMPLDIQKDIIENVFVNTLIKEFKPLPEGFITMLEEYKNKTVDDHGDYFRFILSNIYLIQGNYEKIKSITQSNNPNDYLNLILNAWHNFIIGKNNKSLLIYAEALKIFKKLIGKKNLFFINFNGIFYLLALLKNNKFSHLSEIRNYILNSNNYYNNYKDVYSILLELIYQIENKKHAVNEKIFANNTNNNINLLFSSLFKFWFLPDEKIDINTLKKECDKAMENNYQWLAFEFANLISNINNKETKYLKYTKEIEEKNNWHSIIDIINNKNTWQESLNFLIGLKSDNSSNNTNTSRLIWLVNFDAKNESYYIIPKEQKMGKNGVWSIGKNVALKRLKDKAIDCLSEQDEKICSTIQEMKNYTYYGSDYYYDFNYYKTLPLLVGHPLLFREDSPQVLVELVKKEPEILVQENNNDYELSFTNDIDKAGIKIIKESPTRYNLIKFTQEHVNIANSLVNGKLIVPKTGKNLLLNAVNSLSSIVTIHSDIQGVDDNIKKVPTCSIPHVQLLPIGDGLRLEILAKPFAKEAPYFQPGNGKEIVITEINGEKMKTQRNLAEEKANALELINNCKSLVNTENENGIWILENPEDCLETLSELKQQENKIVMEWPKGEKFRVTREFSLQNLAIKISKENNWFEVSGKLNIDNDKVLDMKNLMDLLEKSSSRFIPIGDNQFLTLTKELQKKLNTLNNYAKKDAKGVQLHSLAALSLQDFTNDLENVKTDKYWQEHIAHIEKMQNLEPKVPSTLQAELRNYQIDGFKWLVRLSEWGVGACLADDMGLGKTLQALALILYRAKKGPTLVVAPTSVGMNWMQEAKKFAPTLNPIVFGGKERKDQITNLKSFDLLVCSYGLLQQETELLNSIVFATIILDEAQAIKNVSAKRSKAAMELKGDCKIITTGTPLENHLGELWNLFNFINPGLLFSLEQFNQKFALPIEKYKDVNVKHRLKKLIQPFILRRKKSEVLEELPPKTEITLSVDMNEEEIVMYEALRRKAIEKIEGLDEPAGAKHLKILAEIMKLRRACCNSKLVFPDSSISSSKLQVFAETLEELLDNQHKVLVFSQFIDHLNILREHLEKNNIAYQYLDGSTPTKEREVRVNAFQAGEGDVFLISLKAGGVGLNLTVADYVIHMDPWWNPAVEDQASDRAHRIGQIRPVTIYRLVTKNTIEEKIVALHSAKRDLADSLLEGTDASGKLSANELVDLIRNV